MDRQTDHAGRTPTPRSWLLLAAAAALAISGIFDTLLLEGVALGVYAVVVVLLLAAGTAWAVSGSVRRGSDDADTPS